MNYELCSELVDVEFPDFAQPGTSRTASLGMIEGEGIGIAYERMAYPREKESHEGIDVGVGADSRPAVLCRLLLVDHYRHGQVLDAVDMWPAVLGQILLNECGKGVVEVSTGLCSNRVEHQRRFTGARNSGKYGNLVFGDGKRQILQVVLLRTTYLDVQGII